MSGDIPTEIQKILDSTDDFLINSDCEPVKILVIGSRQSVNIIVHQLHQLRFAEFNK